MIKKLFEILIVIILVNVSVNSQTLEELMQIGNENYKNENYSEAIESYSKILNQGFESAALYFNIGNSYFKTGQIGRAILNYERALKMNPGDEDIQFNLRLAKTRTIDNIKEVPQLFIIDWWNLLISMFSVSGWALVLLVFYLLLLMFIALYFLSNNINLQRLSIYGGIVSSVFLLIFAIVLFASYHREVSFDYGILVANSANVKVSPTEDSSDSFIIHEGIKFELQDQLDNWAKIKLADGKVGWLQVNSFEKI